MSSIEEVLETLKTALITVRPHLDAARLDTRASLNEAGVGIDSLGVVELIGETEERLDLMFDETTLRLANFTSLERLAQAVHEQMTREGR